MAPRSRALRLVVAIGVALLLALLAGLAIRTLGGQSDDGSSTDESTEIAGLEPELRELIAETSAYQRIIERPVACGGGDVVFTAGPAVWQDATDFRIPLSSRATGFINWSEFELDAYDPAGNSWPINEGIFEGVFSMTTKVDERRQENVEGRASGLQQDPAGIALIVTTVGTYCQDKFVPLLVSLDQPG